VSSALLAFRAADAGALVRTRDHAAAPEWRGRKIACYAKHMIQRGFWQLADVSNERLVAGLTKLLTAEGRTEARIVAHLAELDARRLHLRRAPSLFDYCQRHLGLSENQAYFRIAAARVARQFPVVFELLEQRKIYLTSVALLSKYLTEENHADLLHKAQRLSKRALLEMLARKFPKADVMSHVRTLPVRPGTVAAGPTGTLEPLSEARYCLQLSTSRGLQEKLELARDLMSHANPSGDLAVVVERALDLLIAKLQQKRWGQTSRPREKSPRTPRPDLNRSQSAGATDQPRSLSTSTPEPAQDLGQPRSVGNHTPERTQDLDRSKSQDRASSRSIFGQSEARRAPPSRYDAQPPHREQPLPAARARRHIAKETKRQLLARDGLCCSYVGDDGARCTARAFLEIDHRDAWARGGSDRLANLRVYCRAHNQLLAEDTFGKVHMRRVIADRPRA
jgi:hypothetical protein